MSKKRVLISESRNGGLPPCDFLLDTTDWELYGCAAGAVRWTMSSICWRARTAAIGFIFCMATCATTCRFQNAVEEARPDFVFHLAAQSYPTTSFTSPLDTYDTNISGTSRLLECCEGARYRPCDPRLRLLRGLRRVPKEKVPISEECSFHPASRMRFPRSARPGRRFHAEAYGQKVMTTRMFTHTGPRRGDVFAESTFAKQIAMIEAGHIPPLLKVGNLDSLRTWSDVRDAVRAYYMLVTVNPQPGAYYNIGGNFSCTIRQMLDHLLSLSSVRESRSKRKPPACVRSMRTCRYRHAEVPGPHRMEAGDSIREDDAGPPRVLAQSCSRGSTVPDSLRWIAAATRRSAVREVGSPIAGSCMPCTRTGAARAPERVVCDPRSRRLLHDGVP